VVYLVHVFEVAVEDESDFWCPPEVDLLPDDLPDIPRSDLRAEKDMCIRLELEQSVPGCVRRGLAMYVVKGNVHLGHLQVPGHDYFRHRGHFVEGQIVVYPHQRLSYDLIIGSAFWRCKKGTLSVTNISLISLLSCLETLATLRGVAMVAIALLVHLPSTFRPNLFISHVKVFLATIP